ncbi:MAG: nucleotidyl transferase AbiEii/AbiGii toxin family protein [Gemmatimonadota bacterium]|nr:nucleotidyl transferase AbiEii/AbiGii toxin family protein [Gemmatimonadota bacterium]
MRYETPEAFRAALESQLKRRADEEDLSLNRLRKMIVFERYLARLKEVSRSRWILKGALAMEFGLGLRTRTTRDMDLAGWDDQQSALNDLLEASERDLGDFFYFRIERKTDFEIDRDSMRFRLVAELAGRVFENVILDVGIGDPELLEPPSIRLPDFLDFAGIDSVEVSLLPLEQQIAEKLHAYTRLYSEGRSSSRTKDLMDLLLIARSSSGISAQRVQVAIGGIFEARRTHEPPESLPLPPGDWEKPFARMAEDTRVNAGLDEAYERVAGFLDPLLEGSAEGVWRTDSWSWE